VGDEVVEVLRGTNLDRTTPMAALNLLQELKKKVG
jgi:hypothetical protein